MAPARLAEAAGVRPQALARVIAAALRFDPPQDRVAVALQERLSADGVDAVLTDVCHVKPHEPLAALIRQHLSTLSNP